MLSRRTILKGLTSFSILQSVGRRRSFALGAAPSPPPPLWLNVILHGLFIMHFKDSGSIELLTPFVQEHQYLAGNWDWSDLQTLDPAHKPFALEGVDPLGPFDPSNLDCGNLLSKSGHNFDVKPELAHLSIDLKSPQEIHLLRCIKADKIFSGPPMDNVKQISVCQVLRYPVSGDPRNLKLTGTQWFPRVRSDTKTANLHLWAEPSEDLLEPHRVAAYQQLLSLIPPLQFSLVLDDPAPLDNDTGVPGVDPEEEMGLSEWLRAGEGVRNSDCDCLMVVK